MIDLFQHLHDLERVERIEVPRRFIGDHDLRPVDHRARDRDALALAAGKFMRKILRLIPQPHHIQYLRHEFRDLPLRPTGDLKRKCHVFVRGLGG